MFTDTIGAIQIPQAENAKLEKENQTKEPRPIEDSAESQYSRLDVDKQNIEKKESTGDKAKDSSTEPETYDAAGNLTEEITAGSNSGGQGKQIDLVI